MKDFLPLLNRVSKNIELTKEEKEYFFSRLTVKKVKRKQYIEQPGFVSKQRNYVVKGALRAFIYGSDGEEHTISLAIEDWFIGDSGSFMAQEPGTFFVEAIEDCTLIQISYEDEQLLLENIPKFHSHFRERSQWIAINIQKRVLSNISKSAEERYNEFANEQPEMLERFPLYVIASYLGMSREFLSKIRNNKVSAK